MPSEPRRGRRRSGAGLRRPDRAGPDVVIRPYEARDRERVRHICFVTGFMGRPVEWLWRDEASFADLFSGWWTDHEPESALVAELDGEVAGYLLGCIDSRRVAEPVGLMAHHLFRRGLLVRPGTARVLWRLLGDAAVGAARHDLPAATVHDTRWPAHLHIDLLLRCRGRGVGRALVRRWLDRLQAQGVAGCHLETMAENTGAVAFFEAMGFECHGDARPVPGFRTPTGGRLHVQLMVQTLS
jgi:ribosomal protein S18 acetylase RimI-like enzyme